MASASALTSSCNNTFSNGVQRPVLTPETPRCFRVHIL
jgi:hypothetical protein